jgi:signal transduction histidine kinase
MFTRVGRQLAILNTIVVVAVILLVGVAISFALQRSLNREVDQSLRDRIAAAQSTPTSLNNTDGTVELVGFSQSEDEDDEEDEEEEHEEDDEDREIVASGDTVLLIVDETGMIVDNPRGVDLHDLPVEAGIEAAMEGEVDTRSVTLGDGEDVRVMTAPIVEDGQTTGAVQAIRSLGEHEEQLEIVRRMTILGIGLGLLVAAPAGYYLSRRAMVPINQAFDRQRAFAADASHELRTPLTLIRANAEFALTEPGAVDPEVHNSLENILQEVDRTDRQVDDLLLLARLDARELPFDMRGEDPSIVVAGAVESMRPAANVKQIDLVVESMTGLHANLDADRFQQVIRIVLDNAIKHTEPGGRVGVHVSSDGADVVVRVEDTGPGIPEQDLPHVFERYYRVDKSRSRAAGGAGLGLSIARQIIDAHAGQISIASAPGQGTTVTIRVPAS